MWSRCPTRCFDEKVGNRLCARCVCLSVCAAFAVSCLLVLHLALSFLGGAGCVLGRRSSKEERRPSSAMREHGGRFRCPVPQLGSSSVCPAAPDLSRILPHQLAMRLERALRHTTQQPQPSKETSCNLSSVSTRRYPLSRVGLGWPTRGSLFRPLRCVTASGSASC